MKHWNIIGYAYDADLHCVDCAEDRFGQDRLDDDTAQDEEGNPVHPMFAGDEHASDGEYCSDCGEEIVEPAIEPDEEYRSSGAADYRNRR